MIKKEEKKNIKKDIIIKEVRKKLQ